MFSSVIRNVVVLGCGLLILSACGGGDSAVCGYDVYGDPIYCQTPPYSPPPVASTSSFAVGQAMANIVTQPYSFNVSSVDAYGNNFVVAYSSEPGSSSTFSGVQAITANVTESLYENGEFWQNISTTKYYNPKTYELLGSTSNVAGGSEVVTSSQLPQATATVGQETPLLTATLYRDPSEAIVDGTLAETLGLSADTATTALLCLTDTVQLTQAGIDDGLANIPTSNCFRIDSSGNVLGIVLNTQIGGVPMQFY